MFKYIVLFCLLLGCEADFVSEVLDGEIVVEEEADGLTTCGVFGYPNLCKMTGSMGRALGGLDYISMYVEVPSEFTPNPMTSTTYFSKAFYPNYDDTNVDHDDLRAKVDAWPEPTEWGDLREDWCVDNVDMCYQE